MWFSKPYASSRSDWRERLADSRKAESTILGDDLISIWDRSKDLQRNSSLVAMIERRIVDHCCAKPLTPKSPNNSLAEDLFGIWSENAGIDGFSSLDELHAQIVATLVHRDILLLMVSDHTIPDGKLKTKIQLLDGTRVRTPKDFKKDEFGQSRDNLGRIVVHGVVYSRFGKEVGWYVANQSGKDDSSNFRFVYKWNNEGRWNGALMRRARSTRPDLGRTLPIYQACIDDIIDIEELKTAAVGSAFSKNLLGVLLETSDPAGMKNSLNANEGASDYSHIAELEDRSIATIPWGTKPHVIQSSGSADSWAMIMGSLSFVAGTVGIARPILLQDMTGLNFSTSKMAYELSYKLFKSINDSNAEEFDQVWIRILQDLTDLGWDGLRADQDLEWIGVSAIPETDPDKNASAIAKKMALGLTSASRELAQIGVEFSDVVHAKAEEELLIQKIAKETGVAEEALRGTLSATPWSTKSESLAKTEEVEDAEEQE